MVVYTVYICCATHVCHIHTALYTQHVIERERRGDYLGKTVQVVPHITDAICDWIERVAKEPGTVRCITTM